MQHNAPEQRPLRGNEYATLDPTEAPPVEGPIGEAQSVHIAHGLPRLILTVTVNLLVLAEVCIAMYFAAKNPDEITPIFFKVLFSLLLPTLVLASLAKRFLFRRGKR